MATPILATKLFVPPPRPKVVPRPRLIQRLDESLLSQITLISAPAGFGKTTLVSEWVAGSERPVAWLSLDEGDNDLSRFLTYLVAAFQSIAARQSPAGNIGAGMLAVLQSPQPPPTESILTALLNEIAAIPDHFILVLDDYHLIDSKPVDKALTFLVEHQPPQIHLVIATREDPPLPLARLRARGQLTELRASDLRFNPSESAGFLNQVMGLNLSAEDIAALETRTEGWIAGLQLAALALQGAISMPGQQDPSSLIKSFSGSHHFVLDYLLEEVLQRQPERVQTFLLRTSILDRLCGPLCDAVCSAGTACGSQGTVVLPDSSPAGHETLEYLEHANLFVVPLDGERRWYRYHHLFADLLRQRLHQSVASSAGDAEGFLQELNIRASQWYEDNGLEIEAFHHAAAANDVGRAERLIEGEGMPLHFRGAVAPVLHWLESLPTTVLDAWPSLWTAYASVLLVTGQTTGVEEKLQAAEAALAASAALPSPRPDDLTQDLVGRIAAIRATMAANQNQVETIIVQSRRALKFLRPDNLAFRTSTNWKLGYVYLLQGDRFAASQAFSEVISTSQASGNIVYNLLATIGLGICQETENQLFMAVDSYRRVLQLAGDPPLPFASEAHLGLARVLYEWNDLDAAGQHAQQSLQLVKQIENTDRIVACEVFLARMKLVRGDVAGAAAILAEADRSARLHNFVQRMPEVAAVQVHVLLRQGDVTAAAQLAETHSLPLSQARVHLAQGAASAALAVLRLWRRQVEAKGWADERLKVMVLQAIAHHAQGGKEKAVQVLGETLAQAEPGGFIRIFVDEGIPMAQLLSEASAQGIMPGYVAKLLAVLASEQQKSEDKSNLPSAQPLIEPLSQRELEVLLLIAQGLSNREISDRLFLALDTIKGHNRNIFYKLQVQRRTEAIARARELGLL